MNVCANIHAHVPHKLNRPFMQVPRSVTRSVIRYVHVPRSVIRYVHIPASNVHKYLLSLNVL